MGVGGEGRAIFLAGMLQMNPMSSTSATLIPFLSRTCCSAFCFLLCAPCHLLYFLLPAVSAAVLQVPSPYAMQRLLVLQVGHPWA